MPRDRCQKRDLHALDDEGMLLCNPRDKEAAHRAQMEGIATDDRGQDLRHRYDEIDIGFMMTVYDESEFRTKRDVKALAEVVGQWDQMISERLLSRRDDMASRPPIVRRRRWILP